MGKLKKHQPENIGVFESIYFLLYSYTSVEAKKKKIGRDRFAFR